jgi:hypothetical protein
VIEFPCPSREEVLKGKGRWSTILKVATGAGKTNFKTTTLHPFHPKLPASTPYFLPKNPSPKTSKLKTKLKISRRGITKRV